MDNIYYIYQHVRFDTHTVFYVGKGKGRRAQDLYNRNNYHKNITKKYGCKVELIKTNLTEKEAFAWEIYYIGAYKACGFCEANMANGGEGPSGIIKSKETRKRLSESLKEIWKDPERRRRMSDTKKNIPQSEEHRKSISKAQKELWEDPEYHKKMSKTHIGKTIKAVICYNDNGYYKEFKSLKECALELRFKGTNSISMVLGGQRKTHHGFKFKYKEAV